MSLSDSIEPIARTSDVAGSGTPGAGTPFFAQALTLPNRTTAVFITIATSLASTLSAVIDGGSALKLGAATVASTLTTYKVGIRNGQTLNLQIDTAAVVNHLTVDAFFGGII